MWLLHQVQFASYLKLNLIHLRRLSESLPLNSNFFRIFSLPRILSYNPQSKLLALNFSLIILFFVKKIRVRSVTLKFAEFGSISTSSLVRLPHPRWKSERQRINYKFYGFIAVERSEQRCEWVLRWDDACSGAWHINANRVRILQLFCTARGSRGLLLLLVILPLRETSKQSKVHDVNISNPTKKWVNAICQNFIEMKRDQDHKVIIVC